MLSVVLLNVIMLSVVLLNVIMLSVVAPEFDVWSQDLGLKLQLYLNSGKMRDSFCHKKIMFLYLFFKQNT